MDFIKTKCKQRNVNHIAKYNTKQRGTDTTYTGTLVQIKLTLL